MARDMVMEHLHPTFRQKVELLLQELARANLPFRLCEGFRSPQQQRELYSQDRTRPGAKVTNADACNWHNCAAVATRLMAIAIGRKPATSYC